MDYDYPANKTNLKKRGDYGIRVAKWGYDANTCTDGQLLFNSNWPIIQIAQMKNIDGEPKLIGSTKYPVVTAEEPWELYEEKEKNIAGVDRRYVYTKAYIREYRWYEPSQYPWEPPVKHSFFQCDLYGFIHGLGYTPMFYSEQDFNGHNPEHNRVVLTNVDITKDVDYPYISKPSIGKAYSSDYGVKSKAYYTNTFPKGKTKRGIGLDTAIQGKQIMAVKTQDTIAKDGWPIVDEYSDPPITEPSSCVYYPPKNEDDEYIIEPDQFEYYGFVSNIFALLQSPESFNAGGGMGGGGGNTTNVFDRLTMGYGDIYFRTIVFPLPFYGFGEEMTGARLMPANWFISDQWGDWAKQSLVVVRIPMVSPNVVSVEVV